MTFIPVPHGSSARVCHRLLDSPSTAIAGILLDVLSNVVTWMDEPKAV